MARLARENKKQVGEADGGKEKYMGGYQDDS